MNDRPADLPPAEPVVEPMPEASETPVTSSATPLVPVHARHAKSYRLRFGLVYAGLGAVLLAGIGVFAFVVDHGAAPAGPAWSAWQPKHATRLEMAGQISAHVGPLYRLAPGGAQLAAVQASDNPVVQNVPVEDIALRGSSDQDVKVLPAKNSMVYTLCGLGARCKIKSGTPSQARARLLRREALELALYTFKYVGGIDSVVVHIPPPPDPNTNWALFFQKSDLSTELSKPLGRTLAPVKAGAGLVPASVVGNADQRTVERLTRARWFTSQYQQLPDGNAILVLDPVIAAG